MSRINGPSGRKVFSRPIWVRFTLLYTAIFTLSMMLVLALTLVIGKNHLTDQIREQIRIEVQFLDYEFREDGLAELLEETEERIEKNPADRRFQYTVQNARGAVLFDEFPTNREHLGWQNRQLTRDGKTTDYLFYYQALDGDHLLGVGSSLVAVEEFQAAVGKAFLFTLAISLAIGVASGFGMGVWMSRRLRILLRALRQVAEGKWQTRLAENVGGHEFEELAAELNRMFAQLEQSIANLKYISAGISHDLRTPITRLRNRMARLQSGELQSGEVGRAALLIELEQAQQELDGLLNYFDSALLINELQSGELARNFAVLDLAELLEKMLDYYGPLLEDAGVALSVDLQKPLYVRGMASLLQRLAANLLDNVLIHNGDGAHLYVILKKDSDQIDLLFTNRVNSQTAPADRAYQLPAGIERKKMGQKIIEAITTAHGGTCTISRDAQHHRCHIQLPLV